ncbi:hypothetical protein B0H11DRAFT_2254240 [Mycena galericulata]|nr:hypothetical protein B0H11DRAFT_2254240 [Mycena galericulata]
MSLVSPPVFPPELEREIFEICAQSRPVSIPKLMLVAQVEPLLYRIMAVNWDQPPSGFPQYTVDIVLRAIHSKPPGFFDAAVRHLMLWLSDEYEYDAEPILAACTGIHNLMITEAPDSWLPLIVSLPLTRLYIDFAPFMEAVSSKHTLCWHLMHLDLTSTVKDPNSTCAALVALPQLTHLSFFDSKFVPVCARLLESCICLRVLACRTPHALTPMRQYLPALTQDVRFVLAGAFFDADVYAEDWHLGAQGGADYWIQAEVFIAKRRSREIHPLQYKIPHEDDSVQ